MSKRSPAAAEPFTPSPYASAYGHAPRTPDESDIRPTPCPTFDVEAFARDSDAYVAPSAKVPRAPIAPQLAALEAGPEQVVPALRARFAECSERVQLVRTQLRVGGLRREEAARALTTELLGVEEAAACFRAGSIAAMCGALRSTIAYLGGVAPDAPGVQFDVIVVDSDAEGRARIAIAIEALGHVARGAGTMRELAVAASTRTPDALFVASHMAPEASGAAGSYWVDDAIDAIAARGGHEVPVVVYADPDDVGFEVAAPPRLGAPLRLETSFAIDEMLEPLTRVFGALLLESRR